MFKISLIIRIFGWIFKTYIMKIKILFGFLFITFLNNAQTPVNSFYVNNDAVFAVVTSNTPIDQSAPGANQIWNFDQLMMAGTSNYTNNTPTTEESSTFPNTNHVVVSTSVSNSVIATSQLFIKDLASVISITGLRSTDLELNFSTNNATLGAFPLNYGYTNTDAVAGTYSYTTYSGTFTGNIVTSVDAYGTLNRNIGAIPSSAVTRLKTVLTISLNYGFFSNVGTITQTTYSYYSAALADGPLFRTATTSAVVPLAMINQTGTLMETYVATTLGTQQVSLSANMVQIAPNPVTNSLHLEAPQSMIVNSWTIIDSAGRTVLTQNTTEKTIDVSGFQNGIYFAKINTPAGTYVRRFIKE